MSVQTLHEFMKKAQKDEGLKNRFKEAGSPGELVSLGKENGYNFSEGDIQQASKEHMASGKLKQQDLDQVSGGTIISPVIITVINVTISVCGR